MPHNIVIMGVSGKGLPPPDKAIIGNIAGTTNTQAETIIGKLDVS